MTEERAIPILKISPYIRYVNNITFGSGHSVPDRVIYDHEFILGLSGEAVMEYGDQTYRIGASDLFYIKPNIRNFMYIVPGKSFHAHCVHFDWIPREERDDFSVDEVYNGSGGEPLARDILDSLARHPIYEVSDFYFPPLIAGLDQECIAPLFAELYRYYSQGDIISQAMARAAFLQIVGQILSHQLSDQGVQKASPHQAMLNAAIDYLRENFSQDITTPVLAARFSLSPKYFGVLFKSMTGRTVRDFLLDIRIQQAKRYMIETELSLAQIAEKVGIHDVFYFTKLFSRHERISPGRYRRSL